MTQVVYSVDTSALIDGLERYYPESNFPALWRKIDELVIDARFLISEEVWEEIKQKDEIVKVWAEPRLKDIMVETDSAIARETKILLKKFPRLVMNLKGRNRADPFVISMALVRSATVVTGEGSDGTEKRPKIPFVCKSRKVVCIRFLDLIKAEGWRF